MFETFLHPSPDAIIIVLVVDLRFVFPSLLLGKHSAALPEKQNGRRSARAIRGEEKRRIGHETRGDVVALCRTLAVGLGLCLRRPLG